MELIPIKETLEENEAFACHPDCEESIYISVNFYKRVGFQPPWIGYYVKIGDHLIGAAGFKGRPVNGKVEFAYCILIKNGFVLLGTVMDPEDGEVWEWQYQPKE